MEINKEDKKNIINKISEVLITMASKPSGFIGLAILIFHVILAISSPWFVPYDYKAINPSLMLQAPSADFWFGRVMSKEKVNKILNGTCTKPMKLLLVTYKVKSGPDSRFGSCTVSFDPPVYDQPSDANVPATNKIRKIIISRIGYWHNCWFGLNYTCIWMGFSSRSTNDWGNSGCCLPNNV